MPDEDRMKAAKNLAAVKAFEVYLETIKSTLGEEGLAEMLDGTHHAHTGIVFMDGKAVGIYGEWRFSMNAEFVEALLASRNIGSRSTTPS
jgi:hypothetical protein